MMLKELEWKRGLNFKVITSITELFAELNVNVPRSGPISSSFMRIKFSLNSLTLLTQGFISLEIRYQSLGFTL